MVEGAINSVKLVTAGADSAPMLRGRHGRAAAARAGGAQRDVRRGA
jgi:hypothetical protein